MRDYDPKTEIPPFGLLLELILNSDGRRVLQSTAFKILGVVGAERKHKCVAHWAACERKVAGEEYVFGRDLKERSPKWFKANSCFDLGLKRYLPALPGDLADKPAKYEDVA